MEEIRTQIGYIKERGTCKTPCPYKEKIFVNSSACRSCEYFRGDTCDIDNGTIKIPSIVCAHPIKAKPNENRFKVKKELVTTIKLTEDDIHQAIKNYIATELKVEMTENSHFVFSFTLDSNEDVIGLKLIITDGV